MALLEVKEISKRFGQQTALDKFSFKADKGEIIGFIGPNGAGKSTTMKIITGFYDEFDGEVIVEGCSPESILERKQKIGYLPESNPLYKDMYIKEYLYFIAKTTKVKNAKQRIEDVIEMTGLTKEKQKKIGQLSKGYKQRVGIAQAILHDPELLILDEPISGLDPNQLIEVRKLIKELSKDKCVIFSSHILQEIEAICTRIIIINDGQLVKDKPIGSLLNETDVFNFQVMFEKDIDINLLSNLKGVLDISVENNVFSLETNVDVRSALFSLAVKLNNPLFHLVKKDIEMVDVFKKMTN